MFLVLHDNKLKGLITEENTIKYNTVTIEKKHDLDI